MKVAIIHDWLVSYGGAELFVQYLLKLYPTADIYTLIYDKKKMSKYFPGVPIHTSSLQRLPFVSKLYTKLLSFMPSAIESFDLSSYDLVISSSSCCAKGVITSPLTPHVAFIHSPMRYAWDLYFSYKKHSSPLTKFFMSLIIPRIRLWDYVSSQRADVLIANSKYIARRIKKFWNRKASVIYLPVEVAKFSPPSPTSPTPPPSLEGENKEYYVSFSRLVQYKRVDIALEACIKLNKTLYIIGSGGEEKRLKRLAKGHANIHFLGRVSDSLLSSYLTQATALLFCAEEDYGFTPLEAQVCGCPVIAYGKGGAVETVKENKTGLFFFPQTSNALVEKIKEFEKIKATFNKDEIKEHALTFSFTRFENEFLQAVEEAKKIVKIKGTD